MCQTTRIFIQQGRNPFKVYALESPNPKIPNAMSKKTLLEFCFSLISSIRFDLQPGGFACALISQKEGETSC